MYTVLHFEENRRLAYTRKHDVTEYVCILFNNVLVKGKELDLYIVHVH